jgi:hypothetical protein
VWPDIPLLLGRCWASHMELLLGQSDMRELLLGPSDMELLLGPSDMERLLES